ncbi:uncharacterized protein EAE97_011045 [Botrytis byssoidea]|uniref:Uncharacterized protein n=1 Tax=Botrytis byssoidea TaxID=139641 RepID=A0A9P5LIB4_9HELO|nr:uncharacterized protein EAE97_011045 [Botrytis byssoidea]KAF7922303.1 hypothetical protein EAE97_011045 [Botrytis byssoidea]
MPIPFTSERQTSVVVVYPGFTISALRAAAAKKNSNPTNEIYTSRISDNDSPSTDSLPIYELNTPKMKRTLYISFITLSEIIIACQQFRSMKRWQSPRQDALEGAQ